MMNRIPSLRISTAEGCNHRCSFCQIDGDFASNHNGRSETWVNDVVQVSKRFFGLGVRHFSITGGEPLVNPHITFLVSEMLREMLDEAKAAGCSDCYLRINTNGVFVPRYIEQVAKFYDLVKISLHSLRLETYARITGSHSPAADLENTLKGIEELNRCGVAMRIQSVVTPDNQEELWQLVEFCQSFSSVLEFKLFDMSEYSLLWRGYVPGAPFWKHNFVSLEQFESELKVKGGLFVTTAQSVGGYGNPMPVYKLKNLLIRLRRSDRGAYYRVACSECPAFNFCADGHCNLEIGPNSLIKVCRPKEGPVFRVGDEKKAIALFLETNFNPRDDMKPRLKAVRL
jgi:pyruvate-formate lyase-activating enzyme